MTPEDQGRPHPTLAYDGATARKIIEDHLCLEGPLLPILHALQGAFGCVPLEVEPLLAAMLNITRAEVHGVVSFYHDFRRAPAGRHVLQLCRAEACQSLGAGENARRLLDLLGIDWGGTTPDGSLTVEPVYCLGLCATAPGALLDGKPLGRLGAEQLEATVADLVAGPGAKR
ncbi:MAG: formate dehydrogenase subunit gamma [Acidobacteriaceae bacterium]